MPTLTQYWSDEVTRVGTALNTARTGLATLRTDLLDAEADQRAAAALVSSQNDAVAAARRALAGIPMPADGDPLLVAMENALAGLRAAQAAVAEGEYTVLMLRAELQAAEALAQRLEAEFATATKESEQEILAAASRQALADKFGPGGSLENLVSDALAALAASKADAVARVEGEFPTSGTASKSLLTRIRERAKLVRDITAGGAEVETPAYAATASALAVKQRDFVAAVAALQALADNATRTAIDIATLARLAALPAANPPTSYPILTVSQHARLHDAGKQTQREDTLAKLTDVDSARKALIPVQVAYDKALHAAMKAEPDKTPAELDATTLSAERGALDTALDTLQDARDDYLALPAADREALDEWFAAVPDALWEALDALDGAVGRLEKLGGSPTPGDLILAVENAETALEAALRTAREDFRKQLGAELAWRRANAQSSAQSASAAGRASAFAHSSALF